MVVVAVATALALVSVACGTVDRGGDFDIAEVTFDQDYYLCEVEPMLFAQRCGPGDPSEGDPAGGCHYNVTAFRLLEYDPLAAESCTNGASDGSVPSEAQANYQAAQSQMRRDPELAKLLNRPSARAAHPRRIFSPDSTEAQIIRDWATRFSSQ